jgi:SHS2 domain-containing protein
VTHGYYRLLDHTADLQVEIFGSTPGELFANAARALGELLCDPKDVHALSERTIEARGEDRSELMIDWLRELLYLWNGEQQLWKEVRIESIDAGHLRASVAIDTHDPDRHLLRNDIKAVTYHGIEVTPAGDGWRAVVIFDV